MILQVHQHHTFEVVYALAAQHADAQSKVCLVSQPLGYRFVFR